MPKLQECVVAVLKTFRCAQRKVFKTGRLISRERYVFPWIVQYQYESYVNLTDNPVFPHVQSNTEDQRTSTAASVWKAVSTRVGMLTHVSHEPLGPNSSFH